MTTPVATVATRIFAWRARRGLVRDVKMHRVMKNNTNTQNLSLETIPSVSLDTVTGGGWGGALVGGAAGYILSGGRGGATAAGAILGGVLSGRRR